MRPVESTLSPATQKRIERFVSDFIGRDDVVGWFSGSSDMYINDPERADRCDAAAENGADGSTHAEVINDWREAFKAFIRDKRKPGGRWQDPERFIAAVEAHFDATEAWHLNNGSLYEEIG